MQPSTLIVKRMQDLYPGKNKREIAAHFGVSPQSWSDYLREGGRYPPLEILAQVVAEKGVTWDELMTGRAPIQPKVYPGYKGLTPDQQDLGYAMMAEIEDALSLLRIGLKDPTMAAHLNENRKGQIPLTGAPLDAMDRP